MTHIEKIKIRYQRLINNCDTALRDCQDLDMKEFWLKTKLLVTEKYQIMFFGLVTLFVALSIAVRSAYYSIVGLMAIFSAAFLLQ